MLILDDALARRHANLIGVTLTGRLTELGFRLSAHTRDALLKLANEA